MIKKDILGGWLACRQDGCIREELLTSARYRYCLPQHSRTPLHLPHHLRPCRWRERMTGSPESWQLTCTSQLRGSAKMAPWPANWLQHPWLPSLCSLHSLLSHDSHSTFSQPRMDSSLSPPGTPVSNSPAKLKMHLQPALRWATFLHFPHAVTARLPTWHHSCLSHWESSCDGHYTKGHVNVFEKFFINWYALSHA